ncbi:fructose-bisphosphatase class II [Agromyces soli]
MIVSFDVDALALALRPAVAAAAAACTPLVGSGDGVALDGAAVDAMRAALASAEVDGRVVVGEGEKDEAPMLHLGERFGRAVTGAAGLPSIDIAVDPVDGTRLAAAGQAGAMAVIAAAPRGGFFDLGPAHYLEKLVTWVPGIEVGPDASGGADASGGTMLRAVPELVARAAELRGVRPAEVRIAVQDRPRNRAHAEAVRATGAQLELFEHGDVERSLRALHGGLAGRGARSAGESRGIAGLDGVLGIGGAPEGVIVAAGARALGGSMLARFAPQSDAERERVLGHLGATTDREDGSGPAGASAGLALPMLSTVHGLDALCGGPAVLLVAAVTECEIGVRMPAVEMQPGGPRVHWWSTATPAHGWVDFLDR